MDFCARKIVVDDRLVMQDGLLRSNELSMVTDAQAAAAAIRSEAEAEAERVAAVAREQAAAAVRAAERKALERAAVLIGFLERQQAAFLDCAHDMLVDLAQAAFERLAGESVDKDRIVFCVRQIMRQAPSGIAHPVLWMHPEDVASCPPLEWVVREDAGMKPGSCRLEASSGEWHADFEASVAALNDAFAAMRKD